MSETKKVYRLVTPRYDANKQCVCIYEVSTDSEEYAQWVGIYIADFANASYPYGEDTPLGRIMNFSRMTFAREEEMLRHYAYAT